MPCVSMHSHDHATFIHVTETRACFCMMVHIGLANVSSSPLKKKGERIFMDIKNDVYNQARNLCSHPSSCSLIIALAHSSHSDLFE